MSADNLRDKAEELRRTRGVTSEGLSIPQAENFADHVGYSDESPEWAEQESGEMPENHGFPSNPLYHLESHLEAMERYEKAEEERWSQVGRDADGESGGEDIVPFAEETIEERPMTYEELMSPMSSRDISEQRAAAKTRKKRGIEYKPEVYVFVFGGHDFSMETDDNGDPVPAYDDTEDREKYTSILAETLNSDGRVVLVNKTVEPIQRTSKFKVFLEVLRTVE